MSKTLTLITRSTPVCPNCVAMKMALEAKGVKYIEVDIAVDEGAIEEYGISSVPVSVIKDNEGKEVFRATGVKPPELLESMMS